MVEVTLVAGGAVWALRIDADISGMDRHRVVSAHVVTAERLTDESVETLRALYERGAW